MARHGKNKRHHANTGVRSRRVGRGDVYRDSFYDLMRDERSVFGLALQARKRVEFDRKFDAVKFYSKSENWRHSWNEDDFDEDDGPSISIQDDARVDKSDPAPVSTRWRWADPRRISDSPHRVYSRWSLPCIRRRVRRAVIFALHLPLAGSGGGSRRQRMEEQKDFKAPKRSETSDIVCR